MSHSEQDLTRQSVGDEQPPARTCSKCQLSVPITVDVCPNDGTRLTERPAIGERMFGKYQFLDVIGEGGMSVVYKARHPDLDKVFAVKMLHSHLLGANAAGRFYQEAKAASSLQHRNVITVHDYGTTEDGQQYMVMDYLQGDDLARRIRRKGPLEPMASIDLFKQICDGLAHAHKKGIVHRDLKPSNVVLCKDESGEMLAKLVDFGIAKVAIDGAASGPGGALTRTGEILGSPPYMSPEQCRGTALDARSDVYSLGCLMFEALTGNLPFEGDNFMEIVFRHMEDNPPTLRAKLPSGNFPPRYEALIARCLAKSRADRFQSVEEVSKELDEVRADIIDPSRGKTRRMLLISLATICSIALLAGGIFVGSRLTQPAAPRKPLKVSASSDSVVGADYDFVRKAILAEPNRTQYELKSQANTDAYMPAVAQLKRLRKLTLQGSAITDQGIKFLRKSEAPINYLDCENMSISDGAMAAIVHFPLEYLNVQQCDITDDGLAEIAKIKTLTNLQIARIHPSIKGIEAISTLPALEEIDVTQIPDFNDQWLKPLSKIKTLRILDFEGDAVSGPGLEYLKDLPLLEVLKMQGVARLAQGGLRYLPVLPRLRVLDLDDIPLGDADLAYILKQKDLEVLKLSGSNVTAAGVRKLKALKHLQRIEVVRCSNILTSEESDLKIAMSPIEIKLKEKGD